MYTAPIRRSRRRRSQTTFGRISGTEQFEGINVIGLLAVGRARRERGFQRQMLLVLWTLDALKCSTTYPVYRLIGISAGSVHFTLRHLDSEGFVDAEWEMFQGTGGSQLRRRLYQATDAGRRYVQELTAHGGQHTPGSHAWPPLDQAGHALRRPTLVDLPAAGAHPFGHVVPGHPRRPRR